MKKSIQLLVAICILTVFGCKQNSEASVETTAEENATPAVGQSAVVDETSSPNIVQTASGSKDHTTLVTAVKAAGLVDVLSNAGPFTVFAPTNAAFDKLPKGTVEGLLEPSKKDDRKNIFEYHTYVGNLKTEYMQDGQEYEQVNGGKIKITKVGDKVLVNGSEIVASITTANGMIHVINDVLLPLYFFFFILPDFKKKSAN